MSIWLTDKGLSNSEVCVQTKCEFGLIVMQKVCVFSSLKQPNKKKYTTSQFN